MLRIQGYSAPLVFLAAFVVLWVAKLVWTVIYNLYFHPLARIPGPKIAAATYLYQTYYSIVGRSRFYVRIKELHEIYGKLSPNPQNTSFRLTCIRANGPHHTRRSPPERCQ